MINNSKPLSGQIMPKLKGGFKTPSDQMIQHYHEHLDIQCPEPVIQKLAACPKFDSKFSQETVWKVSDNYSQNAISGKYFQQLFNLGLLQFILKSLLIHNIIISERRGEYERLYFCGQLITSQGPIKLQSDHGAE